MTNKKMLVGSLSNDLLRVANLTHRGSDRAASRFLTEARKWGNELIKEDVDDYIKDIAKNVESSLDVKIDLEQAEKYLMYSVLLQNYSLHIE